MSDKIPYRVTAARPVAGRMRMVGATVWLDGRELAGELRWGGLEPVTAGVPSAASPAPAETVADAEAGAEPAARARRKS